MLPSSDSQHVSTLLCTTQARHLAGAPKSNSKQRQGESSSGAKKTLCPWKRNTYEDDEGEGAAAARLPGLRTAWTVLVNGRYRRLRGKFRLQASSAGNVSVKPCGVPAMSSRAAQFPSSACGATMTSACFSPGS